MSTIARERKETLDQAIGALYNAFGRYRLSKSISGCPCCTSPKDDELVHTAPLRQLTADNLARFAWKAMTTLGAVDDFKHLLPRLAELAVDQAPMGDCELIHFAGKLRYANWQQWPVRERQAIEEYCASLWSYVISLPYPDYRKDRFAPYTQNSANQILPALARINDSINPYLVAWLNDPRPDVLRHLILFMRENIESLGNRKPTLNAHFYLDEGMTGACELLTWMASDAMEAHLESAIGLFADRDTLNDLGFVMDSIEWLRKQNIEKFAAAMK